MGRLLKINPARSMMATGLMNRSNNTDCNPSLWRLVATYFLEPPRPSRSS